MEERDKGSSSSSDKDGRRCVGVSGVSEEVRCADRKKNLGGAAWTAALAVCGLAGKEGLMTSGIGCGGCSVRVADCPVGVREHIVATLRLRQRLRIVYLHTSQRSPIQAKALIHHGTPALTLRKPPL